MPASSMEASNLPVGPLYANLTSFVAVKSSPLHPKRKVTEMSLKRSLFDHFFMSMHQLPFRERASTVQMHHQIPINPQIVLEHPHPHFSFNLPKHSNLRRFPRSSFSHKSFYPPYKVHNFNELWTFFMSCKCQSKDIKQPTSDKVPLPNRYRKNDV